jgi:hypothetical protein
MLLLLLSLLRTPNSAVRSSVGKLTSSNNLESFKAVNPLRLLHISKTTLQGCTSLITLATAAALSLEVCAVPIR